MSGLLHTSFDNSVKPVVGLVSEPDERQRVEFGFTLVEVIMAVAIIGIIAAVVYSPLWGVMRTVRDTREKMELCQTARCILWKMSGEISNAFINERNNLTGCDAKSNDYDGDSISFSSTAKGSGPNQKGISRIEYYLDGKTLFKSLDGRVFPIVKDVDDFNLSYFDRLNWTESWDSSLRGKLPKMIEINLWLKGELFSVSVAVPVTKVTYLKPISKNL